MPTYDYRCKACGHEFELFQSMSAKPERTCPRCGKKALERLIGTGAALLFKGSGFYQTDYRTESYRKAAEADKPAAPAESKPGADSKGDAAKPKTEAKPEPKADSKPDSKTPAAKPAPTTGPAKDQAKGHLKGGPKGKGKH